MLKNIPMLILVSALYANAQLPAAPTLSFPADKAVNISVYTNLKWKKVAGATGYHAQVSTDPAFAATVFDDSALVDTLVQMRKIADSTVFYWRVRALGAGGFGPYSKSRSFTSQPPLGEGPVIVAPENFVNGASLTPTLIWKAFPAAKSYTIQVSLVNNFSTILFEDTGVADTTRKLSTLEKGTLYYWHVRANTTPVKTGWSKGAFTTLMDPPTLAAALTTPLDGAVNQSTSIELSWEQVERASAYQCQLSLRADFTDEPRIDSVPVPFTVMEGLTPNTTYYWRVRGISVSGQAPYSAVRSFKTGSGTATIRTSAGTGFALRARPGTIAGRGVEVEFSLDAAGFVELSGYSVLGGASEILFRGRLAAGAHRIPGLAGHGAGVWILELKTAAGRQALRARLP